MICRSTLCAVLSLALAACDGAGSSPAASESGMPANWKATDACAMLDKGTVGEVLGSPVSKAELSTVTEPTDATAGFSMCSYTLADGKTASLLTRWSPVPDNSVDAIAKTRAMSEETAPGKVVDVPGIGHDAYWVGGALAQLNWFIGDDRYANITLFGFDPAKARPLAEALARRVPG